jgi:hypothetical protein
MCKEKRSSSFPFYHHIIFQVTIDSSVWEPDPADYVTGTDHFAQILRQLRIEDERQMRSLDVGSDVDQYSIAR